MQPTLVCLHGWGGSKESFTELRAALKHTDIRILTPDLPGFGDEPEPKKPWTVDNYANWVETYIKKSVTGEFILLGHSHGGRVAIKLASKGELKIRTLFLCASAGIRHPKHFRRISSLILAKTGKTIFIIPGLKHFQATGKQLLYKLFRVHDYEKASELMQKTLILVSNENLSPLLNKINVPTHIFWGEDDTMTPLSDGELIKKHIKESALYTFENVRHRVHMDKAIEIAEVIKTTLYLTT